MAKIATVLASFRTWIKPARIAVVAALAAATIFLGSHLAAGDPPAPGQVSPLDITPQPPSPDETPPPSEVDISSVPPPIIIGGVDVPVPPGGTTTSFEHVQDPSRGPIHAISLGRSFIVFDNEGILMEDGIAPEHLTAFQPTLDALSILNRSRPPPPLTVRGVQVPLPPGAEYGVVINDPGEPSYVIQRGRSFVAFDEKGVYNIEIAPQDQADFQPTLDALSALASSR